MKFTPYIQYKHSLYTGVFKRVFKKDSYLLLQNMVRTSRRQTLLRTTLPAVEQAEPSEEATLDFSSQPADEADLQTAESDVDQEAEQRIDADRLLPVLIQGMDLPQEAKDHLYQEIQRVRQRGDHVVQNSR